MYVVSLARVSTHSGALETPEGASSWAAHSPSQSKLISKSLQAMVHTALRMHNPHPTPHLIRMVLHLVRLSLNSTPSPSAACRRSSPYLLETPPNHHMLCRQHAAKKVHSGQSNPCRCILPHSASYSSRYAKCADSASSKHRESTVKCVFCIALCFLLASARSSAALFYGRLGVCRDSH